MATKHEESQQPNNTSLSKKRRSALKKMVAGTGVAVGAAALPGKWVKPVVDKVIVPVHAQTSEPTTTPPTPTNPPPTCSGDPDCEQNVFPNPLVRATWSGSSIFIEINPGGLDGATGTTLINGDGNFSGTGGATFSCVGGQGNGRLETEFEGNLNTETGALSGSFRLLLLCDSSEICVLCANFAGTLVENIETEPPVSDVESQCCPDSTLVP